MSGVRTYRWSLLRKSVSRTHRCRPRSPITPRRTHSPRGLAALRLDTVWSVLRGVSRQDRHPQDSRATTFGSGGREATRASPRPRTVVHVVPGKGVLIPTTLPARHRPGRTGRSFALDESAILAPTAQQVERRA